MKNKKLLIILLLVLIILTGVALFIFVFSPRNISVRKWNSTGKFILASEKVSEYTEKKSLWEIYTLFTVQDKKSFTMKCEKDSRYIGKRDTNFGGPGCKDSLLFYESDGIYALQDWDEGFELSPCCSVFFGDDDGDLYEYPAWVDYEPNRAQDEIMGPFDENFGTYEEAVKTFYGYFSDKIVTLDDGKQIIKTKVFFYDTGKEATDRHVEIDFRNKTVKEIIEKND